MPVPEWRRSGRQPELSIVLLAYQEEARIGQTLIELSTFLSTSGWTGVEVLVVAALRSDGSADRTQEIVEGKRELFEDLRVVVPGPQRGKGRDARVGMLVARGRYRIFMDADLATPLHHLPVALQQARSGAPVVIGVRDLTSSHTGLRRVVSWLGNLLVQTVLLPGIHDSQCGFKMFSAPAAESIFRRQSIEGWGFDMELLTVARLLGYRIATVEVEDWQDVPGGTFKGTAVRGTLRTLSELLLIKARAVAGAYRAPLHVDAPPSLAVRAA